MFSSSQVWGCHIPWAILTSIPTEESWCLAAPLTEASPLTWMPSGRVRYLVTHKHISADEIEIQICLISWKTNKQRNKKHFINARTKQQIEMLQCFGMIPICGEMYHVFGQGISWYTSSVTLFTAVLYLFDSNYVLVSTHSSSYDLFLPTDWLIMTNNLMHRTMSSSTSFIIYN